MNCVQKTFKRIEPQFTASNMDTVREKEYDITRSYYPYLVALFCSVVILGNIYALKITSFFSMLTPSGMICFPFTFSIIDIITEVYGEEAASKTIKMGLFILMVYFLTLHIVTGLNPAPEWNHQKEWESIFSSSQMIVIGTFTAYFLGERVNTKLLSILKYLFNKKYFLRRSIASTFAGVTIDTIVFNFVAFSSSFSFNFLVVFTLHQLIFKLAIEVFGSWLSSLIVPSLKKYENLDPVRPRAWIDKYFREKTLD